MLNTTDRYIVFLDSDTLKFMYLSYIKSRNYPVMNKLYTLLHEGYKSNLVITPISFNHILPYIDKNMISNEFLNMMGSIGQIQFHQSFTIRTLQLIRVINSFFGQNYEKPIWRDSFSSYPDEKYNPGFNKYHSISAQNVLKAIEREKNSSQIYFFIESFKEGKTIEDIAGEYFKYLWEKFPDIIKPYLPVDGDPEYYFKSFIENEEIKNIPEYHIVSNILYPLFEKYGIKDVEYGLKDDLLLAAETTAAYMPYCHYYVTTVDVAELVMITRMNEPYDVNIYDHNESSLYRLIDDLTESLKVKRVESKKKISKTAFRKSRF